MRFAVLVLLVVLAGCESSSASAPAKKRDDRWSPSSAQDVDARERRDRQAPSAPERVAEPPEDERPVVRIKGEPGEPPANRPQEADVARRAQIAALERSAVESKRQAQLQREARYDQMTEYEARAELSNWDFEQWKARRSERRTQLEIEAGEQRRKAREAAEAAQEKQKAEWEAESARAEQERQRLERERLEREAAARVEAKKREAELRAWFKTLSAEERASITKDASDRTAQLLEPLTRGGERLSREEVDAMFDRVLLQVLAEARLRADVRDAAKDALKK